MAALGPWWKRSLIDDSVSPCFEMALKSSLGSFVDHGPHVRGWFGRVADD